MKITTDNIEIITGIKKAAELSEGNREIKKQSSHLSLNTYRILRAGKFTEISIFLLRICVLYHYVSLSVFHFPSQGAVKSYIIYIRGNLSFAADLGYMRAGYV